jgi:hypothetical protein
MRCPAVGCRNPRGPPAAYVGYERIGTTANANFIEVTPNLAGGFLGVAMTDEQPGFVVLSALDRHEVQIEVEQWSNRVAGTHTVAEMATPSQQWHKRLRGPQAVIIDEDGAVQAVPVHWSLDDFLRIRETCDCLHEEPGRHARCGAPFTDLTEALALWPAEKVPEAIRRFLMRDGRRVAE